MRKLEGKWIMKKEMRMISKDGTIFEFPRYTLSKEEEEEEDEEEEEEEGEEEEKEELEKKISKEASGIGSNSEPPGYATIDNEVESDLESTARSKPKCKEMKDTLTNNVNNANANSGNGGNGGNGNGRNNGCSYKTFLACNPRDYDGKGSAVALTVGNKMHKAFPLPVTKFLLPEKKDATARRKEKPLPERSHCY
nr:hypothetical protein [Tanacetum cinerariifolium]